jgi:hypothetical protein
MEISIFTATNSRTIFPPSMRRLKDGHRGRLSKVPSKYGELKTYLLKPTTMVRFAACSWMAEARITVSAEFKTFIR